jgi:hypothetical protein
LDPYLQGWNEDVAARSLNRVRKPQQGYV